MQIECSRCEMYRSAHCDDCLVSSLLHPPDLVEIDEELDTGLRTLSAAGLIPVLRFRPRPERSSAAGGELPMEKGAEEGMAGAG